jgi:hypothetical protein
VADTHEAARQHVQGEAAQELERIERHGSAACALREHLARVQALHERDVAEGFGEVHMPFALAHAA